SLFILSGNLYSQQNGILSGKIVDSETGEGLIGANILIKGTTIGTASDIGGNYLIRNISPGTYTLITSMIGYSKLTITDLELKPGSTIKLDIKLVPVAYETDEVVITARMILDNESALLKNRQKSIQVSDAISSEQILRTGSDNAGDAMKKVVGISVVDGKYIYVRGLGERYSSTQLNGTELPSSDPNRKSFQLDLIPTSLLDNIVTIKTFTPDKPGNFSGGIVDISTKSFPDKFTFRLSGGTSYNSQASYNNNFLTYNGGSTDWLGIDDGTRSIPGAFTNPDIKIPSIPAARFNDEKAALLNDVSKSFNSVMGNTRSAAPVNSSFAISIGDNIPTGQVASFGYLGSFTYKRDFSFYQDGEVGRYTLTDVNSQVLNPQLLLQDSKGVSETNWGGLFTFAYKFNPEQEIDGDVFYSKSGISTSRFMNGKWPQELGNGTGSPDYFNRVLHWVERNVSSYQLRGRHLLSGLFRTMADWSVSLSKTEQDEPDFRLVTTYVKYRPQDTTYTIRGSNFDDPSRYFRNLVDNRNTFNLNFSVPFAQWNGYNSKIKFGGMYQTADRNFTERIFSYLPDNKIFNQVNGDLSALFSDANNGIIDITHLSNGKTKYTFGNTIYDRSFAKNNYTGNENIVAGYGMIELPLFRNLRFIGGVRYEVTDINVVSQDLSIPAGKINENDLLPSFNLIYSLNENMNLRFAATQTLARPTFREIAPYSSKEFVNDIEMQGNPNLQRTLIENYDLRWEWFLRPGEILAVSGFYKNLKNPIEIAFAEGSNRSNPIVNPTNVNRATLLGAELEMRLGLDHLVSFLRNFSLGFNLSVVHSNVDIAQSELAQRKGIDSTLSSKRNLQGQSPYTINIDLSYSNAGWGTVAGFYFNTFGERLSKVSANITPDVFEQPAALINFTLSQKIIESFYMNLGVKNILNSEFKEVYRYKGTDYTYQSFQTGRKYSIGISYKL
ncbi:MAG TPA: TonB-dependent receptor, partial [Ignavibacteriales bacterium]|nr:TonB-dependent receptor [Ignavibacteriales bacterium]